MGSSQSVPPPPSLPVPAGKVRICVAGYKVSTHTGRARKIATHLAKQHPDKFETWFYFASGSDYEAFLKRKFDAVPFPPHLKGHASSPFVWLETGADNQITPIGGRSHFCEWIQKEQKAVFDAESKEFKEMVTTGPSLFGDAFHNGDEKLKMTAATA
jgi:hypothetical protein